MVYPIKMDEMEIFNNYFNIFFSIERKLKFPYEPVNEKCKE